MLFVRAALVTVAVAACAWFGLGVVQAHDTDQATNIVTSHSRLSRAQASHVKSLLDTAGTLNPDTTVTLLRAQADALRGQGAQALRVAGGATASEPDNLDAWLTLAQLALHHNIRTLDRAVGELARLDPRLNDKGS